MMKGKLLVLLGLTVVLGCASVHSGGEETSRFLARVFEYEEEDCMWAVCVRERWSPLEGGLSRTMFGLLYPRNLAEDVEVFERRVGTYAILWHPYVNLPGRYQVCVARSWKGEGTFEIWVDCEMVPFGPGKEFAVASQDGDVYFLALPLEEFCPRGVWHPLGRVDFGLDIEKLKQRDEWASVIQPILTIKGFKPEGLECFSPTCESDAGE